MQQNFSRAHSSYTSVYATVGRQGFPFLRGHMVAYNLHLRVDSAHLTVTGRRIQNGKNITVKVLVDFNHA